MVNTGVRARPHPPDAVMERALAAMVHRRRVAASSRLVFPRHRTPRRSLLGTLNEPDDLLASEFHRPGQDPVLEPSSKLLP